MAHQQYGIYAWGTWRNLLNQWSARTGRFRDLPGPYAGYTGRITPSPSSSEPDPVAQHETKEFLSSSAVEPTPQPLHSSAHRSPSEIVKILAAENGGLEGEGGTMTLNDFGQFLADKVRAWRSRLFLHCWNSMARIRQSHGRVITKTGSKNEKKSQRISQ